MTVQLAHIGPDFTRGEILRRIRLEDLLGHEPDVPHVDPNDGAADLAEMERTRPPCGDFSSSPAPVPGCGL